MMRRAEITPERLHAGQEGTPPGRFECRAERLGPAAHVGSEPVSGPGDLKLALFRCTQMILS